MAGEEIDESVRHFLREQIESYDQLEALLLLRRERAKIWSASAIAEAVRAPVPMIHEALAFLCDSGLLVVRDQDRNAGYQYQPGTAELEAILDTLARDYDEKRLEIVKLMNTNAIERVRTQALKTFADAFLVRRKD